MSGESAGTFIATKEHRRFTEFAEAVRKHRYVGLCYVTALPVSGRPCPRRYAHWDSAGPSIEAWNGSRDGRQKKINAALERSRAVFHTPTVLGTLRDLEETLGEHIDRGDACIDDHLYGHIKHRVITCHELHLEMPIVDEAGRLSVTALEFVRDIFDRRGVGVILIGMPSMEKRLSRYPQLYSRVGFAHHYQPFEGDELSFVLTRHWRKLGLTLDEADFTDTQAIASIARITGGNFRLLHRRSCKSNASSKSTACRSSRMMLSKRPAAPSSLERHSVKYR